MLKKSTWFQNVRNDGTQTRNSSIPDNLKKTQSKTDIRKNFFSVRVINSWNELPNDLKTDSSVKNFKKIMTNFVPRGLLFDILLY